MIKTITTSILTTAILGIVAFYFLPVFGVDKMQDENMLGATVTEISGSDTMSNFPTTYNANLNALNNNKIEISTTTLPNITTLSGLTTAGSLATVGTIGTGVWQGTDVGVAYGGTGASTLTANAVLLGNGASAITVVSGLGTSGQFLTSNGAGSAPTWQSSTVNQTSDYVWTGNHHWNTGTSTFNGYTYTTSLQIASSSAPTPDKNTEVANKKYVDDNDGNYATGVFSHTLNNATGVSTVTYTFSDTPSVTKLVSMSENVTTNGISYGTYDGSNYATVNKSRYSADKYSKTYTNVIGYLDTDYTSSYEMQATVTYMSATSTTFVIVSDVANSQVFHFLWEVIKY